MLPLSSGWSQALKTTGDRQKMGILFLFFWLTIYPHTLCCQRMERYKKGEKREKKKKLCCNISVFLSCQSNTITYGSSPTVALQVQSLSSLQKLLWNIKKPRLWDTGILCFLVMQLIILTAIYSFFLPYLQTPNNLANHSKQTFFLLSLLYLLYPWLKVLERITQFNIDIWYLYIANRK